MIPGSAPPRKQTLRGLVARTLSGVLFNHVPQVDSYTNSPVCTATP